MKQVFKIRMLIILTVAFLSVLLFSSCQKKNVEMKCPSGFTGKLMDSRALKLDSVCHFIPEKTIKEWTNRYKEIQGRYGNISKDSAAIQPDFLKAGMASFNSCIIRKLINDTNSIGLRVLLGLDNKNKIHVIFVGIDKDYKDLYVEESGECCKGTPQIESKDGVMGVTGRTGGAEYGQIP